MGEIKAAIEKIKAGGIIIVSDDESRENEGDFIMAAEAATPEKIGFINRYSSGIICAPITKSKQKTLDLPMMVTDNSDPKETAFTVSLDYKVGTSTGISAADRAATLSAISSATPNAGDFTRPGHIFPLVAKDGGVLERDGHTEAAVDFARLGECDATGAICEIVNDDGSMARRPQLDLLARAYNLPFVTIADLIQYRLETEQLVTQQSETWETNRQGEWRVRTYRECIGQSDIQIYSRGNTRSGAPVFVFPSCSSGGHTVLSKCNCANALMGAIRETNSGQGGCIIFMPRRGHVEDTSLSQIELAVTSQILKDVTGGVDSLTCFDAELSAGLGGFGVEIRHHDSNPGVLVETGNVRVLDSSPHDTYGWRLMGG